MSSDLRTFAEWAAAGRAVTRGQKAQYYRVAPDRSEGYAVFSEDQTEQLSESQSTDGWEVIPTEEWKADKGKGPAKPTIIFDYDHETKTAEFWCGSHNEAVAYLRKKNYAFDVRTNRWRAHRPDLAPYKVGAWFEEHGYKVKGNWKELPAI